MDVVAHALAVVALLPMLACGSAVSPSSPPVSTTLTGSATDATGDAVVTPVLRGGVTLLPVVAVLPDLVSATVAVSNGNLTATISLAPGTLVQADTSACLMLDVDESPATGAVSSDAGLGYDYSICAVNPPRSVLGQVSRLGGGIATGIGTAGATFPTANQISFTAPLSMLGNDDGRMAFKVQVIKYVDDPIILNTNSIDWMPDVGKPAALIR